MCQNHGQNHKYHAQNVILVQRIRQLTETQFIAKIFKSQHNRINFLHREPFAEIRLMLKKLFVTRTCHLLVFRQRHTLDGLFHVFVSVLEPLVVFVYVVIHEGRPSLLHTAGISSPMVYSVGNAGSASGRFVGNINRTSSV